VDIPTAPDVPNPFSVEEPLRESRYGRAIRKPARFIEAMMVRLMKNEAQDSKAEIEGEIFCLSALFPNEKLDKIDPL
jgi:hypothetical protein